MELAIDVMHRSVNEPRADGKASPLVGAVLQKPDGTVGTACRGELRYGDHAEYTLLERKNRHCKLDGAILFATLEPCAPGARNHPKLSCAERIVLARIKEVWVGIEDPDPTVDRKGIKYLQDNGVTVHMFDRDFQEIIRSDNKEFIDQALERAAAAEEKKKPKTVTLSDLENRFAAAAMDDFSFEALEQYRTIAKIKEKVGSPSFNRRLVRHGLLKEQDDRFVPTGFGLLLFGEEPRISMQQAGLLGTIHYSDGMEEPRDFDESAVFIPELALKWLKDKLPDPIDRSQARRRDANKAVDELVREGLVNALVHRDYDIKGAKCQLIVYSDKVVIMSPGEPVAPITIEKLQAFDAPMLSRNPVLHYVFAKMELAEERGLGLKSMRSQSVEAGLPLPSYSFKAPYVVLTIYRDAQAVIPDARKNTMAKLSEKERLGWNWLVTQTTVTTAMYQEAMGIPNRTAKNHLKKMTELGLLKRVGAGRATKYEVVRA